MKRIEYIKSVYDLVANYIGYGVHYNDRKTREEVKGLFEKLLINVVDKVICDETNNTPELIDKKQMIVRLMWSEPSIPESNGYIDLPFGKNVEVNWEYESESLAVKNVNNKVFLIDIDGTVSDDIKNEDSHLYSTAGVLPGALEIINKWYDEGNVITFFTARESKDREVTEKWLDDKGFKYHGLVMDKPRIKDGQEYCWIDNRKVRAVTYLGTWGELKEVDAKIQTFG